MKGFVCNIYALCDPRTNTPFYVGKTSFSLGTRLYGHITSSKYKNISVTGLKHQMIQSILSDGLKPKIELLKTTNIPIMSVYYESYFYNKFLMDGYSMLQAPLKYGAFHNSMVICKRSNPVRFALCRNLPIIEAPKNLYCSVPKQP